MEYDCSIVALTHGEHIVGIFHFDRVTPYHFVGLVVALAVNTTPFIQNALATLCQGWVLVRCCVMRMQLASVVYDGADRPTATAEHSDYKTTNHEQREQNEPRRPTARGQLFNTLPSLTAAVLCKCVNGAGGYFSSVILLAKCTYRFVR